MILLPGMHDVTRFRARIVALLGLYFDDSKLATLTQLLHSRTHACQIEGGTSAAYLDWLDESCSDEIATLARELTVTETYFLRNIDQFRALTEVAVPERLRVGTSDRKIEILSAGCASGEEPYSLAIALREYCPAAVERAVISAFDLNPAMLQKAARARYSNWSLRDLPEALKKRWFKADGDAFKLSDTIRKAVRFEPGNLSHDAAAFSVPQRFDIVFCRNVLMYFSTEQARAAIDRIARAMAPGGYLFLGHAESLRGLSNDFHLCHSNDTFYYQRKHQRTDGTPLSSWIAPAAPIAVTPLPVDIDWFAAIQQASERIHALTPAVSVPATAVRQGGPELQPVLDDLHAANYQSALDQIDLLMKQYPEHAELLLLQAVALSQSGALADAEIVCEVVLEHDEFNAGAHYVRALCREGQGDLDGAQAQDNIAVYLDAGFAMPRLHLGLLARRRHERSSARSHLQQALALLQREDTARILLFGGGFKREALIDMCNAELSALGEPR